MTSPMNLESGLMKWRARHLRQEATPAEEAAWKLLRGRRLGGQKFRRQHALHGCIVDFYCHESRLCVELDGTAHLGPDALAKDRERDIYLQNQGYKVLHIKNEIVLKAPAIFRSLVLANSNPNEQSGGQNLQTLPL